MRISEHELDVNISERWSTAVKGIRLTGKIYIQTQRWTEEVGAQVHGEPCRRWQVQLDTKKNSELGSVKVEQEKLREVFFFLCFVRLKVISDNILHIVNREKQLTWDIHILLYFCIKIRRERRRYTGLNHRGILVWNLIIQCHKSSFSRFINYIVFLVHGLQFLFKKSVKSSLSLTSKHDAQDCHLINTPRIIYRKCTSII